MSTIVMVAQWYPPCQAWPTAATRARLIATHLPEHGWQVIALVPDLSGGGCPCAWCVDPGRLALPCEPGTAVHRLPARRSIVRAGAARLRRRHGAEAPHASAGAPETAPATSLVDAAWLLGDVHSNWARVVGAHADRLLDRGEVDVIWTTSAPFAHIRMGRRLARKHGLPWVADLRDPVSTDVTAPEGWIGTLVRAGRRRYRAPLLGADIITAATAQVVETDGPWLGRKPVLVLPGFDDQEWAAARAGAATGRRFEIVFTGKLYESYRRPDVFLQGLRLAAGRLDVIDRDRVRFVYYGRSGGFLRELAERYGCSDLVEDRGFVPPTHVPALSAGATVLLLLTNDVGSSGVPGGKFYEYLAAHRPVLAVPGSDHYVAGVLSRTGAGMVAQDELQVADLLCGWVAQWRREGRLPFTGDRRAIDAFSARASAKQLAGLLDAAVARRG